MSQIKFKWCLLVLLAYSSTVSSRRPPNVLVFFIDDMGYGDLGCQGNKTVDTPNIDILASEGVRFTQWISGDSICTPSRGALLTGRLPVRIGLAHHSMRKRLLQPLSLGGLPLEEHTLAEALKERGFMTHISGKWHLGIGRKKKFLPQNHGFDHHYGMAISNVKTCGGEAFVSTMKIYRAAWTLSYPFWISLAAVLIAARFFGVIGRTGLLVSVILTCFFFMFAIELYERSSLLSPKMCILYQDDKVVQQPVNLYNLTQRITEDASQFIQKSVASASPFFLYLSYHKMHSALFSNEEFKLVDEVANPHYMYISNLRELDWSVGYIVEILKDLEVYEDTVLWFVSDNGPLINTPTEGGSNSFNTIDSDGNQVVKTLRSRKGTIFEGGFRVPGMVVYKRRFPSGIVSSEAVNTMDIFPTSIRLVDDVLGTHRGLTYSTANPHTIIDGKDITDFVESMGSGKESTSPHAEMVHYCGDVLAAVRIESRYKAIFTTPKIEEYCSDIKACQCKGQHTFVHDPPLLFDLHDDIEESNVLTPENFPIFDIIMERVDAAVERHMLSREVYPDQPSQMNVHMDFRIFPEVCCGEPFCKCDHDPYTTY